MFDFDLLNQFQNKVKLAVAASSTPSLPIKFVGITFKPPTNQKYLEIVHLPNNPPSDFWGNERNYMGSFRLVLHWPNNSEGAYTPGAALTSIGNYFTKNTTFDNLKIYDNPSYTGVIENGSEMLYPCTIRYTCFRP